jgi:hypothetical protein
MYLHISLSLVQNEGMNPNIMLDNNADINFPLAKRPTAKENTYIQL